MWLASGTFRLEVATSIPSSQWDHFVADALEFQCLHENPRQLPHDFRQDYGYGWCALLINEPIVFNPASVNSTA
jgi:hypothetical protein